MNKAIGIVNSVIDSGGTLFSDQFHDGYFSLDGTGLNVPKLKSKEFQQWLSKKIWKDEKVTISSDVLAEALRTLDGIAAQEGKAYELNNRIARVDDTLYYDLGAGVIEINKNGWSVNLNPPILFKRQTHQKPQVEPVSGGDPKKIFEFLNLKNEHQKILFLVNLATSFIPNFSHPLFVFYGPQGAAKTTASRMVKDLVDPSCVETLTAPKNIAEFVQLASHHAMLVLDNLSFMPTWLSDALSQAVTGSAFSKRELYSDDEDILYSFQRSIILNGINLVVDRPDLMDRAILFELERISEGLRRGEQELWRAYQEAKPAILGGVFDALSFGLNSFGTIGTTAKPRMADFYLWGMALAKPLGFTSAQFEKAYWESINEANDEALEANPIGLAIKSLTDLENPWEGPAHQLLKRLTKIGEEMELDTKSHYWPKEPRSLWKRIMRIKHNLLAKGIQVDKERTAFERKIIIRKLEEIDSEFEEAKNLFGAV